MLIIVGAMAFAIFEPIQVLPRIGPAPGYALTDADGDLVTSEEARGRITLYSFAPTDCGPRCDDLFATMAEVADRVEREVDVSPTELRLITVALDDGPSIDALDAAGLRSGADGDRWRWIGGDAVTVKTVVGSGFGRYFELDPDSGDVDFDPGFVLVDGAGVIRGEYRYQTLASDADKLVHHIDILAAEARNAHGATAVAYEAAHLFLCYP